MNNDTIYKSCSEVCNNCNINVCAKEQYLDAAWDIYKSFSHSCTLGMCLRNVCAQFQTKEHSILSRLDGHCALEYFNTEFKLIGEIK